STLRVAGQQADPAVVDLVHRNAQWRITVRRFQVRQLGTECSAVQRERFDRAAPSATTRGLGVVIGVLANPAEPQWGVLVQERNDLGSGSEVGVAALFGYVVADNGGEVVACPLFGVDDAR